MQLYGLNLHSLSSPPLSDGKIKSFSMVKMAASDDDSRSEVSEILASCDNTSPKKKEPDMDQNSETSSDPFEVILIQYIMDHL